MKLLVLAVSILAACGTADSDPPRDTVDSHVASEVSPDAADTSAEDAEDDSEPVDVVIELDEDVAQFDIEIHDTEDTTPLDRNCEFDPRLGNQWPDDARCKACRSVVGSVNTKVTANLIWWAEYDHPAPAAALCEPFGDTPCSASVDQAEVVYCENIDSGKIRVVWMDVGVVTAGVEGNESTTSMRGPGGDLLVGEIRLDEDNVLKADQAFTEATWTIATDAAKTRVTVEKGRPNQACPVGRFQLNSTANGTIQDCERAVDTFVGH